MENQGIRSFILIDRPFLPFERIIDQPGPGHFNFMTIQIN